MYYSRKTSILYIKDSYNDPIEFLEAYGVYYRTLIKIPLPKIMGIYSPSVMYDKINDRTFLFSKTYHLLHETKMIFTSDGIVYEDKKDRHLYEHIIDIAVPDRKKMPIINK